MAVVGDRQEAFDASRRLALLDALPEAVLVIDDGARVLWVNRRLTELAGHTLDDLAGRVALDYVHPDDVSYMLWSLENRFNQDGAVGMVVQIRVRHADGSWLMGEILGRALFEHDDVRAMVVTFRDLSRQSALADSPARLRSMMDRTTDVLLLLSPAGEVLYASRRLTSLLGHDCDRAVGTSWLDLLDAQCRDEAATRLTDLVAAGDQATERWRATVVSTIGVRHTVELHAVNQLDDPVIDGVIVAARDVTDLVAMELEVLTQRDALAYEATHDHLTGLANRSALIAELDGSIERRRTGDAAGPDVVVLFADLDGFKSVNDEHGHHAGDLVLQATAERLLAAVRETDTVARHGGDEFVVLLDPPPSPDDVERLVERIVDELRRPVDVGGGQLVMVGVSVGTARVPVAEADVDSVLRVADGAMYRVKQFGRR